MATNKRTPPDKSTLSTKSALSTYRSMRDPAKTPEPMGDDASTGKTKGGPSFVIQEHHARALHWDFRLERDGVLVSWAIPKGLPLDPKVNHLAVRTEDHPLEYASFEGEIPKGEYGGGQVTIWDRGTYELEKWRDKEVMVVLHGSRASGRYVLFPTSGKNWMIHRMDSPPKDFEPMPQQIDPMLATASSLPKSAGWAFEIKWDGVRAITYIEGGRARALTRNGKDLLPSFPEFRELGTFLGSRSAIFDGEIVAFDENGRPSFGVLQPRLHLTSKSTVTRRAIEIPIVYVIFDILYLDGHLLVSRTYDERRAVLEQITLPESGFAIGDSYRDTDGSDLFEATKRQGLEGILAKRRDSVYRPGQRSDAWLKIKHFRTQEVVIGGWAEGKGHLEGGLGALLLGVNNAYGALDYVGRVGTGFDDKERIVMQKALQSIAAAESPFVEKLSRNEASGAHFCEAKLVGEVQFGEWTSDGRLRHPIWRGLRPDKEPSEVVREP